MTYQTAKPRYTIHFDGKDYDVEGSFQLIDAIEWALKDNIINIAVRSLDLPVTDTAKLLAIILNSAGEKLTHKQVGEILFETLGVSNPEYTALCINIHAFLRIMIAKPSERNEVRAQMGEMIGKLATIEAIASRGLITGESA